MAGEAPELPSKVLMTADTVGGVWQYAVDLSAALASAGVEIRLAILGPEPSREQLGCLEAIPGVTTVSANYSLEWMQDPWRDVDQSGSWLLEQQDNFRADIIHLNGFSHAALPWDRPVVCVGHSCVRSWWQAVHVAEPGAEWAEYTRRVTAGLQASTCVVTPSAAMKVLLSDEYGTPAGKIQVIHNSSRLREYNGKQREAFILAAGRMWDRGKNFALLDEIAPRLDWPVRIAGAESGPSCSDHLNKLGVLPHGQLVEQYRRASIFAHPALYEPFGLSVLEAARSRCCLVLSNIPSLQELWGGAAVFLDPRDPELWVFEINALCRDFSRRGKLSDLAAKRSRRYSSEAMLAGYLDLYKSLLTAEAEKGVAA